MGNTEENKEDRRGQREQEDRGKRKDQENEQGVFFTERNVAAGLAGAG